VWSLEVVEVLPLIEFGFEIDVAFIAQQLIKLLAAGAVWSFYFSVEFGRAAFDKCAADTAVFDMPVELGLELMTIIGSDFSYPEWELVDDVIDKVLSVSLGMLLVDLERADAGGVINGGILEAAYFLFLFFPMKVWN
jgi:hypothetical protein